MGRVHGRTGRGSRLWAPAARWACALAILMLPVTFSSASGQFTGATADDGNSVTSAEVAPPSDLFAVQSCVVGPGIAFRAATSATGVDTLTLPTPTGTLAGDVLVAQVTNRYTAYTLSPPSGWTLVRRNTSGSQITSAVFWRLATSTEPVSATFSLVGTSGVQMVGGIAGYSGVHTSSPIDVSGVASGTGTTITTASVTTTVANTVLVHTLTKREETHPAPTGTTQRWRLISGSGTETQGATAGDEPFAGPGTATGRTSASPSNSSAEWIAHTVALRPIPDTPSATLQWTASPSSWAEGYTLERIVAGSTTRTWTVTPVSNTSTTDGPLVLGWGYTYRLWTHHGTWTSPALTITLTASC